jgi:hypothetical protein
MAVSVPFSFSPGTTIFSAQVNANFAALVTGVNNVVAANIGATGIYASNIIPLNASEATFGGTQTYTFPAGVTLAGPLAGVTSFSAGAFNGTTTISTFTGGTANSLTTGGFVQIGSTGGQNVIYDFAGIQGRNAGAVFALALQPLGGNVTVGGALEATSNASTQSFVPPIYTAAGAAVASTAHILTGFTTIGTITNGSDVSVAVSLTGAAQFTGSTSYVVTANIQNGISALSGGGVTIQVVNSSGSSFSLVVYNTTGGTITGVTVEWIAIGT